MAKGREWLYKYITIIPLYVILGLVVGLLFIDPHLSYFAALFFVLFITVKGIFGNITGHIALSLIKKNMKMAKEIPLDENMRGVQHLVLVPVFKENNEALFERLIKSVMANDYFLDSLAVIFVTEENDDVSRPIVAKLMKKYEGVYEIVHPKEKGILPGKSAAMAFAGKVLYTLKYGEDFGELVCGEANRIRNTVGKIMKEKEIIIHDTDIDMVFPTMYFKHFTKKYYEDKHRDYHIYQPAILLINNMEKVPGLSLNTGVFTSYSSLTNQMSPFLMNFSSYGLSLKFLRRAGFWRDDVIQEDSAFYWKAKLTIGKKFKVVPLYMPLFGDAVNAGDWKNSFVAQTKQIVRWAYGVDDARHIFFDFKPNIKQRIFAAYMIFQNHTLWEAGGILGIYAFILPTFFLKDIPWSIWYPISMYFNLIWVLTAIGVFIAIWRMLPMRNDVLMSAEFKSKEGGSHVDDFWNPHATLLAATVPTYMIALSDYRRFLPVMIPLEITGIGGIYLMQKRRYIWLKKAILIMTYPASMIYNSLCALYAAHLATFKGKIKYEVTAKA